MTITSTDTRRATRPASQILERTYNWRDDAACARTDPETFYPQGHTAQAMEEAAKRVCGGCPVREECLDYALSTGQYVGVWGGLSESERRGLIRNGPTSFVRCLEDQEYIERRLAQNVGRRTVAQELGVSYEILRRAVYYFQAERKQEQSPAGEVAAV